MAVYEKLAEVQARLNCPKLQHNSFGNFNYRSLEDILTAVKPLLRDVGAVLMIGDEVLECGGRVYVKATARFIDTETGEEITNTALAREAEERKGMDSSQVTGSTSSYARKYCLNGLFDLDDVRDADAMEPKKLGAKYVNSLKSELSRTGVSERSMLKNYGADALEDLSFSEYQDAMKKLEGKKSAA